MRLGAILLVLLATGGLLPTRRLYTSEDRSWPRFESNLEACVAPLRLFTGWVDLVYSDQLDRCMRSRRYEPKSYQPQWAGGPPSYDPVTRLYVDRASRTRRDLAERRSICMSRHTGVDRYPVHVMDQFDVCMFADEWEPVDALPPIVAPEQR